MASLIQNYVTGMVQNAATGAATYAITTGGRYVGDAVISAGDLIEGAGRNVGNGVEGYIDRYGNWIRSYGNAAISATAASSSTPIKPGANKQKALPSSKTPKALPAPGGAGRPTARRTQSDPKLGNTGGGGGQKALPSSGVQKALPPAGGKTDGLSKGQLAKLRGVRAEDLKKGAGAAGATGAGAVGGAAKGATGAVNGATKGVVGGVTKGATGAVGGLGKGATGAIGGLGKGVVGGGALGGTGVKRVGQGLSGGDKKKKGTPYAASVAGDDNAAAKNNRNDGANGAPNEGGYPKPSSRTRADGKVVMAKESKPGYAGLPKPTKTTGGGVKKDDKGRVDFMRVMAEEPKKKGPGSVAGSVKSSASKKKAGGKGGDGKQDTSGKYDFF